MVLLRKIIKKLASYFSNLRNYKHMRKVINNNSDYLETGLYNVKTLYKKVAYIKSPSTVKFINKNVEHLNRNLNKFSFKVLIRKLFDAVNNVEVVNKSDNNLTGSLIMITQAGDAKIFDFNENRVINLFANKEEYNLLKKTYEHFAKYFSIPFIEAIDNKNVILEKYIDYRPYKTWTKEEQDLVVNQIFENHTNYFKELNQSLIKTVSISNTISELKSSIKNDDFINLIDQLIKDDYYEFEIPITICNGDVNFYNILIEREKIYFIDWEYANDYYFFYDLFNFIFVESGLHGNDYFLNKYLKGDYDDMYDKIFSIFDFTYDKNYRKIYITIFVINRIMKIEMNIDKDDISENIDQYISFLKKLNYDNK